MAKIPYKERLMFYILAGVISGWASGQWTAAFAGVLLGMVYDGVRDRLKQQRARRQEALSTLAQ